MGYKWKTRPYKHQVRAVKKALKLGTHIALLMEPRTGKTKTTIDILSILAQQGKIRKALIVCPARVMDVWAVEFAAHSPVNHQVIIWDAEERKRGLPSPDMPGYLDLQVVVTNYEAFSTPGRKLPNGRRSQRTGRFKVRNQIKQWIGKDAAAGVLDESHKIKSPSGKAATMLVSMRSLFVFHAILTGTPVTKANRVHDAYMQWKYVAPERFADLPDALAFKQNYGRWINSNGYDQWTGPRNMDDFRTRIHADSFAVRRDECFDLPEVDTQIIDVKLGPSTARAYKEMAEEMITTWEFEEALRVKANKKRTYCMNKFEETGDKRWKEKANEFKLEADSHTIEASIKLVQSLRLAQITSGCATTDEGEVIRIGNEKVKALEELVEHYKEVDEKVVVAARFKSDLDAIALLGTRFGLPVFQLRGGISRTESTRNIESFKRLDGAGLFVMQPQSGSLGIDLSTARHMVWFSLVPSFVDFSQSNDRIALSKKSRTYTYLLVPGSIDTIMYEALQSDKEVADYVTSRPDRLRLK